MTSIPWFPVLPEWFSDGACVGVDPALFEPSATNATGTAPWRGICNDCPVVDFCRNYAIEHEQYGNWGGLTAKEREQLKHLGYLANYQPQTTVQTNEIFQSQPSDMHDVEISRLTVETQECLQIEVTQLVQDIDLLLLSIP